MKLAQTLYAVLALAASVASVAIKSSGIATQPASATTVSSPAYTYTPDANPLPHIDTINNTHNIPTMTEIQSQKLTTFCTLNAATAAYCTALQSFVTTCAGNPRYLPVTNITTAISPRKCNSEVTMDILEQSVELNPCATIGKEEQLKDQICRMWWVEAKRCKEKSKRGPCADHHVLYLLRRLRNFLGLGES